MNTRKGFTLIEILIVVAIIAILSSVVLVGLGPTQQSGRDARRLSDLRQVQTALALYYNKCGIYPGSNACVAGQPGGTTWTTLSTVITTAGIGITNVLPNDPSSGKSYTYFYPAGNAIYAVGATLENANNAAFQGYTAPTIAGFSAANNTGGPTTCTSPNFCLSL